MNRQDLAARCRAHIDELDQLLARLRADLDSLGAAQPADPAGRDERLRAADQLAAALRDDLAEVARRAGRELPAWTDRPELEATLNCLMAAWAEREAGQPRERLRFLAKQVERGRLRHKLPVKTARLESLRQRVPAELLAAAERPTPPEFNGPDAPADWLAWAWALDGSELQRLIEALAADLPALAELLEEGDPQWWKPAPAAEPPAPAEPSEASEPSPNGAADEQAVPVGEPVPVPGATQQPGPTLPPTTTPPPALGPQPSSVGPANVQSPETPRPTRRPAAPSVPERAPTARPRHRQPAVPPGFSKLPAKGLDLLRSQEEVSLISSAPPGAPLPAGAVSAPIGWTTASLTEALAEPVPAEAVPDLPDEVRSLAAFAAKHWVAPSGCCEPVPWSAEGFTSRLDKAQDDALRRAAEDPAALGRLWAFARAAEALDHRPRVGTRTVADLAAVWADPHSPSAGRDPQRIARLRRDHLENLEDGDSPDHLLCLFLEAVRPSHEAPLSGADAELLMEQIPFRDAHLRQVVRGLLRLGTHTGDPVERLRAGRTTAPATLEQRKADLDRLRRALYAESMRVLRAAGSGYVGRFPHCSKAWNEFMERITPKLKAFYPPAHQGLADWDVAQAGRWIAALPGLHDEIADRHEAREKARKTMDRAAHALADQLAAVNEALRQVHDLSGARHDQAAEHAPLDDTARLLAGPALKTPDEEMCRRLLARQLDEPPAERDDPLALHAADLLAQPDLLGLLAEPPNHNGEPGHPAGRWDGLTDPLRAAAVLLEPPAEPAPGDGDALDQLARHLKRNKRFDLLGRLAGRLAAEDQKAILKQRNQALDGVQRVLSDVQHLWPHLADLGAPQAWTLLPILDEARRLAGDQPAGEAAPDLVVMQAWLERLHAEAERALKRTAAQLERSLAGSGEPSAAERLRALREGRFCEAVGGPDSPRARSWRETPWRAEAAKRFAQPRVQLGLAQAGDLPRDWTQHFGTQTHNRYHKLRTSFAKWVFAESAGSLYKQGDNSPHEYRLPCKAVRDYLARQQPTYLPQLADFADLVLLTPPVLPSDSSFVAKTADLIARQSGNAVCAVLAPALQPEPRRDLLKELRKRGAAAGVLDDLDLCRVLNPGGRQPNLVIGLLEILFEQQRWTRLSPFAAPEGTQVRMEMYVGRRHEAEALARTGKYTRLFSGRKLGKTALLKFIEQTLDGQELPSHLKLRVLYVPIVGVQTEADLVSRVIEHLRRRLHFEPNGAADGGHDADTLVRVLNAFIDKHPHDSLLFVLDEADEFVLAQLDEYEKRREGCLTFRLRSEVVSLTDSSQLSRVRFVFSGYRATATYGGPWAHWGDVLQLAPLSPEEAADLVAGPLARLGIDAAGVADAIAFRCGYQPAVLLRFGEELLKRLEGRYGYSERQVVSAEDVAETFHQPAVQDEIRMVVQYNFQGNPAGRAVFAALLLEFARLPPGQGLRNADEAVLERLRGLDADTAWLQGDDNSARGQIAYQLSDFVKRQLLVERPQHGETGYALKFPYHLSVLLAGDQVADIRNAIASLRGESKAGPGEVRGLVPPRAMQDLLEVVRMDPPEGGSGFRAAAVGTHWPQAVNHRSGGLPNRLGIDPAQVMPAAPALSPERVEHRHLAVLDATPVDLDALLGQRPAGLPAPLVTGGADLLRDVLFRLRAGDLYEVCGLGRLSPAVLRWWFTRVRCLDFPREDDLEQIRRRTSGIPFLVRILDELLVPAGAGEGGINVSAEMLREALEEFDRRLAPDAALLVDGPPTWRLNRREIELLRMLHVVSAAHNFVGTGLNVEAALGEEWAELYAEAWQLHHPGRPTPAALGNSDEDQVALQVVELLGLVPTEPDRPALAGSLRSLDETDALVRLLEQIS
jgi:hypothetical protein